jgi:predicted alpha/beta hydrolase family esterase
MKKQIVFIHGGSSYSRYEDFLEYLRTNPIEDPLQEKVVKKWRSTLKDIFADTHEVYYPQMPNSANAKYGEWKIWFERYFQFLRDDVILIGHSLGGFFLAKYLCENTMPVRVKALYLCAAPFEPDTFGGEDCKDFGFDAQLLPHLTAQVGAVYIFHSKDDHIVPYVHAEKYAKALPQAKVVSFEDKNHFLLEEFPEIVAHIQKNG